MALADDFARDGFVLPGFAMRPRVDPSSELSTITAMFAKTGRPAGLSASSRVCFRHSRARSTSEWWIAPAPALVVRCRPGQKSIGGARLPASASLTKYATAVSNSLARAIELARKCIPDNSAVAWLATPRWMSLTPQADSRGTVDAVVWVMLEQTSIITASPIADLTDDSRLVELTRRVDHERSSRPAVAKQAVVMLRVEFPELMSAEMAIELMRQIDEQWRSVLAR